MTYRGETICGDAVSLMRPRSFHLADVLPNFVIMASTYGNTRSASQPILCL